MTGKKLKTKTVFILFIITAVIFLAEGMVLAEEPQFRLDIDSLNLQMGTSASLVLSTVNVRDAEVKDIEGLQNFNVLSTSQSTSTRIVNGKTTYQKDINYIIMPKKTGQFTLQGIVEYKGSTYRTNILQINVDKGSDNEKGVADDLFLKTILPDDKIYFGQKTILSYELYSRYNIENFGFLDDINIAGFIISDVPQDKLKANYAYIGGNKYVKYEARQMFLSPIKTGEFTIPAYNFQVNVSTGDFFNSSKPVYLQTESRELTVIPLPVENQPADFSGLVGKLALQSEYSRNEIDYGDSLTLRVTASGSCNLEVMDRIILNGIPGFSVYETEKLTEETVENNQYKAKKEFELILVPEKNGDIKIDPIHIPYFDPESGSYEKAEIPGTTVTVRGEIPQAQTKLQNETPVMETVIIDQISYSPKNDGYLTIQLKKEHLLTALVTFIVLLLLTALVFMVYSFKKKQDRKLTEIYNKIKISDDINEIYNLFNKMIKYRFNISLKANSRDKITNRFSDYEFSGAVLEIMDYMENKKQHSNEDTVYLKDKIKEIYKDKIYKHPLRNR